MQRGKNPWTEQVVEEGIFKKKMSDQFLMSCIAIMQTHCPQKLSKLMHKSKAFYEWAFEDVSGGVGGIK